MRNNYEKQMENLNRQMIIMGKLCEQVIATAIKMTVDGTDEELRQEVLELDGEIDRKEREIENICMKLLLRQQPVATDLRMISSALKMISDMERIGDQAADIVEFSGYLRTSSVKFHIPLKDMANEVIKMVTKSIDSFVAKDLDMAKAVIISDDVVDRYFDDIKKKLILMIAKESEDGEEMLDILMVAKYLERIGDHATNIAGWVEYSILGTHVYE